MLFEFAAHRIDTPHAYPVKLTKTTNQPIVLDWEPMIRGVLGDLARGCGRGVIAARCHNTLADMIVAIADRTGEERVVLTGGCFQNRRLTETTITRLKEKGFKVFWHQRVPPNDGGIALGQIVAALKGD